MVPFASYVSRGLFFLVSTALLSQDHTGKITPTKKGKTDTCSQNPYPIGKLHIIIKITICLRIRKKKEKRERAIDKLPKNLIRKKKLMAEMASFIDVGKLLIRTTPENLNGFFPSENLGFSR